MKVRVCAALLLLVVTTGIALRAETPAVLTVRLYNTSAVPMAEVNAARREAEPILRATGLDVVFRPCGRSATADTSVDPCSDPLKPSEAVVRIIQAPAFNTTLHAEAYGVTYVARDTDRGWLATVFSDRILDAATRVGLDPGTLLGRVMAHEIGHLLLGGGYHGDAGVMRAEWPDVLLTRTPGEWRFSAAEVARMHRVLTPGHDFADLPAAASSGF
jgi:hypothetical protein